MINKVNDKIDRIINLDILRIVATIGVILLHVSAQNWYTSIPSSFEWNIMNFYNGLVRWVVPIFVMISGILFLDPKKEISIKSLFKKNILRLITAFVFWSFIYTSYEYFMVFDDPNSYNFITNFFKGYYHLWFLYMLIGIYIIVPILRKIVEDKKITEYFLALALIFTSLIPFLLKIPAFTIASSYIDNLDINIVLGFSGYFILGYYLYNLKLTPKVREIIYLLSLLSFLFTIIGGAIISNYNGVAFGFHDYLFPNVLLESLGIFIFFKEVKIRIKEKTMKNIRLLSKYTFGIYLIHPLIIILLNHIGLNTLSFAPILSVPLITIIVFILSTIFSISINQIPFLKKYIV